jgi:predicted NAD/FAD-binding protein
MAGERKVKCGAFFRTGFHPDFASVALDDLFAESQSDAGSRVSAACMQSLEDHKNPFCIQRIDANPVILNGEQP